MDSQFEKAINAIRELRRSYVIVALTCLLIVIATYALYCYLGPPPGDRREILRVFLKDIMLPGILAVGVSAAFIAILSQRIEGEFQDKVYGELRETFGVIAQEFHMEFVPTGHYSLSNEGDEKFGQAMRKDLSNSEFLFFSGLSARVALIRLFEDTEALQTIMIRLPLSKIAASRALTIFRSVKRMRMGQDSFMSSSNEFFGFQGDRDNLRDLAQSDSVDENEKYLTEIVNDSVLFAFFTAKMLRRSIYIRDWDETAEFRIEMMTKAVYLGNYHSFVDATRFSPGTSRFADTSFIYKLLKESVANQMEDAKQIRRPDTILFTGNSALLDADIALRVLREEPAASYGLSEEDVKTRFREFRALVLKTSSNRTPQESQNKSALGRP